MAVLLVERNQFSFAFSVAVLNHQVADDDRRGSGPPLAGKRAQIVRPKRVAVDAIAVNAAFSEKGDDSLAVGCAGRRGPAVLSMRGFRSSGPGFLLPKYGAVLAVDAHDEPLLARFEGGGEE